MKILIVDDDITMRVMLQAIAEEMGYTTVMAENGQQAITILKNLDDVRLVLLDWEMPVMNGLEACKAIRSLDFPIPPYLLLLTARKDINDIVRGLKAGANDYVVKPFEPQELMARMDVGKRLLQLQNELYIVQQKLTYQAHYDSLTGLPNRTLCLDRFSQALIKAKRFEQKIATFFIDLDHFKQVNDTYGHPVGDQLLCEVAKRLNEVTRECDTVGRLSGDEFFILLEDIKNEFSVQQVVDNIFDAFKQPINLGVEKYTISLSIGISVYPNDGDDVDSLLTHADLAMYQAKKHGRNQCGFYTNDMSDYAKECMEIQTDLRAALINNELELHYQPIIDPVSGKCLGIEALSRWHHAKKGWIPPNKFIPLSEESNLIIELGQWVMKTACQQMMQWQSLANPPKFISINVSGKQITQDDFVSFMQDTLKETNCDSKFITLELTESFMMHESKDSIESLEALRDLGLGLAIDDFGTGYSSLTYLKRLPITRLKLDQSFVRELPTDQNDVAITRAILKLAEAVGLDVIAEGIETQEQLNFLQGEGCRLIQGYFYGKPEAAEKLTHFFQ